MKNTDITKEMLFWLKRMRKMIETPAHFHSDAYAEMIHDSELLIARVEREMLVADADVRAQERAE